MEFEKQEALKLHFRDAGSEIPLLFPYLCHQLQCHHKPMLRKGPSDMRQDSGRDAGFLNAI